MSTVYIIKDENHFWGIVENIADIAPFIISKNILSITDSQDNDFDLIDLLNCDDTEEDVVTHLNKLTYPLQKLIFEQFGISIIEEKIWHYSEYLHNGG